MDNESYFGIEELFFSETDFRGIILEGNSVFQRVSEYENKDLILKPHSIIRHPDMPRGVFKLLWDTIRSGEPIVAYVKNRSRTGAYYWVLACVYPVNDKFLSIRIKPSSEVFSLIPDIYTQARIREQKAADISASLDSISGALNSLGFKDYRSFMSHALALELASRKKLLKAQPHLTQNKNFPFESTLELIGQLMSEMKSVISGAHSCAEYIRTIESYSLNMILLVNKVGDAGRTMGAVVHGFKEMAREVLNAAHDLRNSIETTQGNIENSQLLVGMTKLSVEMISLFFEEDPNAREKRSTQSLKLIVEEYLEKAKGSLNNTKQSILSFLKVTDSLSIQVQSLEIARITGHIEMNRKLPELNGLATQLDPLRDVLKDLKVELLQMSEKKKLCVTLIDQIYVNMAEQDNITQNTLSAFVDTNLS